LADLIKGATGPAKVQGIINDLTSLVKRKKVVPDATSAASTVAESNGSKRKAQHIEEEIGQSEEKKSKAE
jgi:hypothetical protein